MGIYRNQSQKEVLRAPRPDFEWKLAQEVLTNQENEQIQTQKEVQPVFRTGLSHVRG
jgi:hypothetical protein